jgi:tRNA(Ser,Leu) C12 N-acetylase TAN1
MFVNNIKTISNIIPRYITLHTKLRRIKQTVMAMVAPQTVCATAVIILLTVGI